VIDRAREQAAPITRGDAHAPLWYAKQEVDGAVERVDDPAEPALPLLRATPLLAHEAVCRAPGGQQLADRPLGGEIRLADQVGGGALARHPALGVRGALGQQAAGHAR